MGVDSCFASFSNVRISGADLNEECEETVVINACPLGMIRPESSFEEADAGEEHNVAPSVGLEFDSVDSARECYSEYAKSKGFKIRAGQLYRSRTDGSVSLRKYVCWKEGFQINSRTGCAAFIRVRKLSSGKWMIDQILNDHNHELGLIANGCSFLLHNNKDFPSGKLLEETPRREKVKMVDEIYDARPCPSGTINVKRAKASGNEEHSNVEPQLGLVFNSADNAYHFYQNYADGVGFKIRIGQLFRSRHDGSITSRRFVCSKEGFQHPSRVGCHAFMKIKKQESGTWVVDRLQKDHNHDLQLQVGNGGKNSSASRNLIDELNDVPDVSLLDSAANGSPLASREDVRCAPAANGVVSLLTYRENNIGSDWYSVLLAYFQTKQAEDTGFFYSVQVDDGCCMSIFWADRRARFLGSQFGDVIVLDTSYRNGDYQVPLATFLGVNHHRQPVLLGCALVANEWKESFVWMFQTWLRAMSGAVPKSIIADQDEPIQQSIAEVFPGAHHHCSPWQTLAEKEDNLRSLSHEFKCELNDCVLQSQAAEQSFFAGISLNKKLESYFDGGLNARMLPAEFISHFEHCVRQHLEEERRADFDSNKFPVPLQTNEPIEEHCRKVYTSTVFKIFQNELLLSRDYFTINTCIEGNISQYSVCRSKNVAEKHSVTFNVTDLNATCCCRMFEFEGVLCKHILRVFVQLGISEIPPQYLLHRWTKNAQHGYVSDVRSGATVHDVNALMAWSLREAANKCIDAGISSLENYKLVYEIIRRGEENLCWLNIQNKKR